MTFCHLHLANCRKYEQQVICSKIENLLDICKFLLLFLFPNSRNCKLFNGNLIRDKVLYFMAHKLERKIHKQVPDLSLTLNFIIAPDFQACCHLFFVYYKIFTLILFSSHYHHMNFFLFSSKLS